MTLLDRLRRLFGGSSQPQTIPNAVLLNDLLERARSAQYTNQFDESLALLAEASEIAEAEHDLRAQVDIALSRADILIAQDDLDTAEWVLNELKHDSEERGMSAPLSYALSSLGVVALGRQQWNVARDYFEQARERAESIKTDGASGRAMGHLAEVYWHEGNASYAAYLLEEAIPRLDNSGDRELLGHFYMLLGKAQIASGQRAEGIGNLQQGLVQARALKHHRQIRALSFAIGEQALAQGDFQRAQSYFNNGMRHTPQPQPQTAEMAHILSQMSRAALGVGETDDAIKQAQNALTVAEASDATQAIYEARAALGLALYQQGNTEQAMTELQVAVDGFADQTPSDFTITVLRRVAALAATEGDNNRAEKQYQAAIERAADLPFAQAQTRSDLGSFYAERYQLRDAIEQWQQAIERYNESGHSEHSARTTCDIAVAYDRLGDGRMAQREYGHTLEMLSRVDDERTRGVVLANIAAAYSEYGDLETAEDFFKEAISIAQKHGDIAAQVMRQANYGRMLALTGRGKEALSKLSDALAACNTHGLTLTAAVIMANIGLAYTSLGQVIDAEDVLPSALTKLDPLDAPDVPMWQATVHLYLGMLYPSDKADAAQTHYQSALTLAQTAQHIPVIVDAQVGLAQLALNANDLSQAQTLLNAADPVARRLQYKRILARLYAARSRYLGLTGDANGAQAAWDEAEKLRRIMKMPEQTADWV